MFQQQQEIREAQEEEPSGGQGDPSPRVAIFRKTVIHNNGGSGEAKEVTSTVTPVGARSSRRVIYQVGEGQKLLLVCLTNRYFLFAFNACIDNYHKLHKTFYIEHLT